jgi:hypothetical protein
MPTNTKVIRYLMRRIKCLENIIDRRQELMANLRLLIDQAPALLAAGQLSARLMALAEAADDLEFDLSTVGD